VWTQAAGRAALLIERRLLRRRSGSGSPPGSRQGEVADGNGSAGGVLRDEVERDAAEALPGIRARAGARPQGRRASRRRREDRGRRGRPARRRRARAAVDWTRAPPPHRAGTPPRCSWLGRTARSPTLRTTVARPEASHDLRSWNAPDARQARWTLSRQPRGRRRPRRRPRGRRRHRRRAAASRGRSSTPRRCRW
jgi:hypothetical protein